MKVLWLMPALLFVPAIFQLQGGFPEAQSAQRKLDSIERGTARRGSTVSFSPGELNSWMREEAKYWVPQGVRDLRLDLAEERATGYARIDFLKLKQAGGEEPGYLVRTLLSGERPVSVRAHFTSRNGLARVDVERVEISGVPLEGAALDFLIQTYLRATFPEARAGEWFRLDRHVDHFAVHANVVDVVLK